MFFHGGIGHLIGNLWVLWIFGNNVEDELGHVRYAFFYLVAGVVASMGHVLLNPSSTAGRDTNIAWEAHVVGFAFGVIAAFVMPLPTTRRSKTV